MICRSPEAIVQAALMDRDRCDLFVEGLHDKLVLEFLCGERRNSNVRVLAIDTAVLLQKQEGGAKARVLRLAELAEQKGASNLRFLVDRDFDPFVGATVPTNTWQTDLPDTEGYLLHEHAFSKVLRLCYCNTSAKAASALGCTIDICRQIGILRVYSLRQHLDLPISRTKKARCVATGQHKITLDFDRFLTSVLQTGKISLKQKPSVLADLQTLTDELDDTPSRELVRGKDFMEICPVVLRRLGIESKEFPTVLWATLDAQHMHSHATLTAIIEFMREKIEQEN